MPTNFASGKLGEPRGVCVFSECTKQLNTDLRKELNKPQNT